MAGCEARLVELEAAMGAGSPSATVERGFLGGAQHPAECGHILVQGSKDPYAPSRCAGKETVHLGQRERLVAEEHNRSAAGLSSLEDGAAVTEQRRRVALA